MFEKILITVQKKKNELMKKEKKNDKNKEKPQNASDCPCFASDREKHLGRPISADNVGTTRI